MKQVTFVFTNHVSAFRVPQENVDVWFSMMLDSELKMIEIIDDEGGKHYLKVTRLFN